MDLCTNGLLGLCPVDSIFIAGTKSINKLGFENTTAFHCGHPERVGSLVFNNVYLFGEEYMELLLVP